MRIRLNGDYVEVTSTTLDKVLVETGYEDAVVATALNGEFVPADNRRDVTVSPGDNIEVLAPMQGG